MKYETCHHLRSHLDPRRTPAPTRGPALGQCLHAAPLPDPAGQCQRPDTGPDRSPPQLHGALRPQRHPRFCHPGPGLPQGEVFSPSQHPAGVGCRLRRTVASSAPPESAPFRQTPQHLDAHSAGSGLSRQGLDPPPVEQRDHPFGHPPLGRLLATGQALDHQSRPGLRAKKKRGTD